MAANNRADIYVIGILLAISLPEQADLAKVLTYVYGTLLALGTSGAILSMGEVGAIVRAVCSS